MTHEEIIDFLKNNTTIYDLWPEEVRRVADGIERRHFSYRDRGGFAELLSNLITPLGESSPFWDAVYRLSPDYQPPKKAGKWVKWPVRLLINSRNRLRYIAEDPQGRDDGIHMENCIGIKGFGGIMYEDCECKALGKIGWNGQFVMVPPNPCEKHGPHTPVKVRFWKEG